MSPLRTYADRHVLEALVAAAVIAVAVVPTFMSAAVGTAAALIGAVVVVLARFSVDAPISRSTRALFVLSAVGVLFITARAFFAENMRLSLLGKPGQYAGALTWLALLALACAVVVWGRRGDLGRVLRAVSMASAVLAIAALVDATGAVDVSRFSPEAAGFLESSISLGQMLVLGTGCGIGWALISRDDLSRVAGGGFAALSLIALPVSGARSGLVALATAAAIVALVRYVGPRSRRAMMVWGAGLIVLAVVALGAGWFLIGPDALERAHEWAPQTNQRTVIWASAYGAAAQSPVLGRGPEQFSAWVAWLPGAQGIRTQGAYDPHNILLAWLVAGGVLGFIALASAAALGLARLFETYRAQEFPLALAGVLLGLLAWGVSLLSGWTAPFGAFLAVMVFSAVIGASDRSSGASPAPVRAKNAVAAGLIVLAVAALVVWGPRLVDEMEWSRRTAEGTLDPKTAARLAIDLDDPSGAAVAIDAPVRELLSSAEPTEADTEDLDKLAGILERNATWHVDAANGAMAVQVVRLEVLEEGTWDDVLTYVEAGRRADPASGLWDYTAAVQAERLGLSEEAAMHADRALEFPLPEGADEVMESILAEE